MQQQLKSYPSFLKFAVLCAVVMTVIAQPDCTTILNTDGSAAGDGAGGCVCRDSTLYTWNGNTNTCDANCATDTYASSQTPQADGTCACVSNYTFSNENGVCWIDCPNIDHTDGTASTDGTTCICITSFDFNPTSDQCEINCGSISHATSPSTSISTCDCDNAAFEFNTDTFTCDLECEDVAGAISKTDSETCECHYGLDWNSGNYVCDVNCGVVYYSVASDGADGCTCVTNFNWDASTKSCVVDCSQYIYTQGSVLSYNECNCEAHFKWLEEQGTYDPTLLGCQAVCKDDPNSQGVIDPANAYICLCNAGFAWNLQRGRCEIICDMQYTTGEVLGTDKCACVPNTIWDAATHTCLLDCSKIPNTNGAPAVSGACTCKNNYAWNPLLLKCSRIA